MGRTEEALREFQRAIDLAVVPAAPDLANASRTLMIMGRFEEAKKILDEWRQKGSLSPDQIAQRYRNRLFENDAATMERLAREAPADDMHCSVATAARILSRRLHQTPFAERNAGEPTEARETDGNAANELAWHAQLESFVGNYALARSSLPPSVRGE